MFLTLFRKRHQLVHLDQLESCIQRENNIKKKLLIIAGITVAVILLFIAFLPTVMKSLGVYSDYDGPTYTVVGEKAPWGNNRSLSTKTRPVSAHAESLSTLHYNEQ